ncbi:MAG: nucleotidyltransferase domain-containing protein [Salinivenus sp.]
MPADLESLLADLRSELDNLYGDRLVQLVLYGSQVRGEVHKESDVDVLVDLDGPIEPGEEIRRMGPVRTRVGLRHEQAVSLLPVSETDYENRTSAWLQAVHEEGHAV